MMRQDVDLLARKSLVAQCREMQVRLDVLSAASLKYAEQQVLAHFRHLGYHGAMCEAGPVLLLIKSLTLDELFAHNIFGSRQDACTRFLEAQFTILVSRHAELVDCVGKVSDRQMLRNFDEIYSHASVRECYPGVDAALLRSLRYVLGRETLTSITRTFAQLPYDYRSGWPDLTLVRGRELRLIEVKTTDKLHSSQLRWIEIFRPLLAFDTFSVVQLRHP